MHLALVKVVKNLKNVMERDLCKIGADIKHKTVTANLRNILLRK